MQEPQEGQKLGFLTATSLVVGNMIGSGIFLIPATLAVYGGISIYGWLISGVGAILLAIVYSRLSKIIPTSGGPYIYTRQAFGDFSGFIVAWGYWISILCTNAAIAVTLVGYLAVFSPFVLSSNLISALTAIAVVWLLCFINSRGVKEGGRVQLLTTYLKIAPLLLIAVVGIFYMDLSHFDPWNISNETNYTAVAATVALTFFAFMGMESATIPSENIRNSAEIIPKATMSGTVLVILIYTASYVVLVGLIPPIELQNSTSPFADGASIVLGSTGKYLVGIGAIISTFGALNGWILLQGQIPFAVSRDKLFPKFLGSTNSRKAPVAGLVTSSIFVTLLIVSNYTKGLVEMYKFMILLTTVVVIFPYLFCSMAETMMLIKKKVASPNLFKPLIFGVLATGYLVWVLTGVGNEEVFYGLLLIFVGIPVFAGMKLRNKSK